MNRSTRSVCLALGALAISAAPAVACVNVGVYQDKPGLDAARAPEEGGQEREDRLDLPDRRPRARSQAHQARRKNGVRLIISWLPDKGSDSVKAPGFRLSAIAAGKFDARPEGARAPDQGAAARRDRPPDARPQHAVVRVVGHRQRQPPRRLRAGLEARAQGADEDARARRSSCSGASTRAACPTTRRTRSRRTSRAPSRSTSSAPTPTTSATPRASTWTAPADLFLPAYGTIQKLAAKKPFWISETGSTARGGDEGAWIGALGTARQDHAEAGRSGLVRRPRQHRRLPRTAQGAAAAAFKAFAEARASNGIRSHDSLVERE